MIRRHLFGSCLTSLGLIAGLSSRGEAQAEGADAVTSLEGLRGVGLIVIANTDRKADAVGIRQRELQRAAELRLREAGIRILEDDEIRAQAQLRLVLSPINASFDEPPFLFTLLGEVRQRVEIPRSGKLVSAVTWRQMTLRRGLGDKTHAEVVKEALREMIEEFINDYLRANPK